MSEMFVCSVNIECLEADVKDVFQTYINSGDVKESMMMTVAGKGRIAREFIDYLVLGIDSTEIQAIALVRNDLFIQFLVSSINLRCPQTSVKAFKTSTEARAWLSSLFPHEARK